VPETEVGRWFYSVEHREVCRVIEKETLWGEEVCRVWLPGREAVVRVPAARLLPLQEAGVATVDWLLYVAAAARIADALTQNVLLAPIGAAVIPLPHQIRVLSKAVSGDRVRYLLADEVGLGKTIEAGLIMRELKLRGLVRRTLVLAPRGLVTQWVAEMRAHFGEEFRLLIPGDFSAYRRIAGEGSLWRAFPQVVCPMDSVKPLKKRRGWSREQVEQYNRERFYSLISAGWDLLIVDEAHRLAGSTEQVARYKLGRALATAAPYLLLLSATPHQGKTDQFRRLMSLLDPQAFPDEESICREHVQPYVIRTEKRHAIDPQGRPLFKPRRTQLVPVSWKSRHSRQRLLYEAVTQYVREGYNLAMREKRGYIGFLMSLMQRLVASSTRAIRTTLERRLEALRSPHEQMMLFPQVNNDEWADMDGQEQIETLLKVRFSALKDERAEVESLLELAKRCESEGPDLKAEALLDWIYRLQAEEGEPDLKVLVFTEFVATQQMLCEFLAERGFGVVRLNGSMSMEERERAQKEFAEDARILVSTDAGGEGLNLQFCHIVINYDIPWNPMRLEQRIGRVDRIGQTHTVRAINFVLEDSVEHRVLEVLEEKLSVIFEEMGVDKFGDVLDSADAARILDDLYVEAILNPDTIEAKVDEVIKDLREQIQEVRKGASVLGCIEDLDTADARRVLAHPLPHWVERMTVCYLRAHGGKVEKKDGVWTLTWPDGGRLADIVFATSDAERKPSSQQLTLENPKIRRLVMRFTPFAPGQPIPVVAFRDTSLAVRGFWSLWEISLSCEGGTLRRIMPLFVGDDDRVLAPTARHVWDRLMTQTPMLLGHLNAEMSRQVFERLWKVAEQHGRAVYDELTGLHHKRLERERKKWEYVFAARRKVIERIGLPAVREHRMRILRQEEERFRKEIGSKTRVLPEMAPLVIVRVEGNVGGYLA